MGWLFFATPCLLSYALGHPARRLLVALRVMDQPNERSSHVRATPRGGGLAIVPVVVALAWPLALHASAPAILILIVLGGALAAFSLVDDVRSLSRIARLAAHAGAALLLLMALPAPSGGLGIWPATEWHPPALAGVAVLFLWLVGYTNAYNFMDGINGLASLQAVTAGCGTALIVHGVGGPEQTAIGETALVVAGASAGFVPHNFPVARMFMGDVGSVPLGFLLAGLAVCAAASGGWWLLVPLALLHTNFVLDTAITFLRRAFRGEKWWVAHREHFYQRLARTGKSHTFVTTLEAILQLATVAVAWACARSGSSARLAWVGCTVGMWGVFYAYCEASFQRSREVRGNPPGGVAVCRVEERG